MISRFVREKSGNHNVHLSRIDKKNSPLAIKFNSVPYGTARLFLCCWPKHKKVIHTICAVLLTLYSALSVNLWDFLNYLFYFIFNFQENIVHSIRRERIKHIYTLIEQEVVTFCNFLYYFYISSMHYNGIHIVMCAYLIVRPNKNIYNSLCQSKFIHTGWSVPKWHCQKINLKIACT